MSILGTLRSLDGDHGERVVPRPRTNRRRASSSPRTTLHNNQPPPPAAAVSSPLIGNVRPIPAMPSPLFQQLAQCQLELLGNSLFCYDDDSSRGGGAAAGHNKQKKKIKSMALYLPQENAQTGQLEFSPAVVYPPPNADRVFIASDADSGIAPALPPTLTKLPGFAHATSLLPGYPMLASGGGREIGIGVVEEVLCDIRSKGGGGGAALSVPLFSGSQTVGVLLVSPAGNGGSGTTAWTDHDRRQVGSAAQSLSLALSMEAERLALERQTRDAQDALLDGLHQLKNPLQALRTYGKVLQQRLASDTELAAASPQVLELADHILAQSDRLTDRLKPIDAIVDTLRESQRPLFALEPAKEVSLVRWQAPTTASTSSGAAPLSSRNVQRDVAVTTLASAAAEKTFRSTSPSPTHLQSTILCNDDEMEITFLEDVLEPILSAFAAIAEDRRIDFSVQIDDDLPGVMVCPLGLQEIVSNLLDNAVKYTGIEAANGDHSHGGRSAVRVRLKSNSPSQPPGATILVEDTGPGIPEKDRDAIFVRGYRGQQALHSGTDGSGLGLDIAQTLVQRMGGTLRLLTRQEAAKNDCLSGAAMEITLYRHPTTSNTS